MKQNDENFLWNQTPEFSIGAEFYESLTQNYAAGNGDFATATLECCARIVASDPKSPVRDFRETQRPNSPVRVRRNDGAIAKRTHITEHGIGLRLMMWKLKSGSFEFANIGGKFENVIRDGSKH